MLEVKTIGSVGVDSGQLFLIDPCYIKYTEHGNGEWNVDRVENENGEIDWVSKNDPTLDNKQNFYTKICDANRSNKGYANVELGTVFGTAYGDGEYAVKGLFDDDGLMVAIFVDMVGDLNGYFQREVDEEWV
jgi:hypothetical protein